MPLYDLMLLLDPGAPSDRQETILKDVQGLLEKSGKVVGDYDWGSRRMTFEIDHRPDAAYHLFQFETEGGPAPLEQVDHSLKIMDGVLRHRIIRLKDGSPPPAIPRDERRGYEGYDGTPDIPAAPAVPLDPAAEVVPETPEGDQPADVPATADVVVAEEPPTPADSPAPVLEEAPPPPETSEPEADPAGGGDDAPEGDTAA